MISWLASLLLPQINHFSGTLMMAKYGLPVSHSYTRRHSATSGDGLLVVPDRGENVAYLAFRNGSTFQTEGEAHALGFGFCPYLTPKIGVPPLEIDSNGAPWIPSE